MSVCTANTSHAAMAIQALRAGKHVLCEKPMATTLEDCEAMVAAAQGKWQIPDDRTEPAPCQSTCGGQRKFWTAAKWAQLVTFETHFCHPGPEGWTGKKNSWFFDKRLASFGAMADLGVHKTDLHHLAHRPEGGAHLCQCWPHWIKSTRTAAPITVDDNAFCTYTLEGGSRRARMAVGWTNYGTGEQFHQAFIAPSGVIRMYDDPEYSLIVEKRDGTVVPYALDKLTSNKDQTGADARTSTGVIDAFIESMPHRHPARPSAARACMPAMKAVFANQLSASRRQNAVDVE